MLKQAIIGWVFLLACPATAQQVRTFAEAEKIVYQAVGEAHPCLIEERTKGKDGSMTFTFFEKHTPDCWGGQGDENTSPRHSGYVIDKQGIVWREEYGTFMQYPIGNYKKPIRAIANTDTWQHPAKAVFQKYGVVLQQVRLYADETYPIFWVEIPEALRNNKTRFALFQTELLKANAEWDCSLWEDGAQYKLQGKKRK
jgi:hypothetical protein